MASFNYTGRNANGEQVNDNITADGINAVAEKLLKRGITPTAIEPVQKAENNLASMDVSELFNNGKVSLEELIVFCRQMYALMRLRVARSRSK